MRRFLTLSLAAAALVPAAAFGQNLVTNGTFSNGATGFTTVYQAVADSADATIAPGSLTTAAIVPQSESDWLPWNPGITFLCVNGSDGRHGVAAQAEVWAQQFAVQPRTLYKLSYRQAEISTTGNADAVLNCLVNGVNAITGTVVHQQDHWQTFTTTWYSGNTDQARMSLLDMTGTNLFNDFAVTDIRFQAVPEPGELVALAMGAIGLFWRRRTKRSI